MEGLAMTGLIDDLFFSFCDAGARWTISSNIMVKY